METIRKADINDLKSIEEIIAKSYSVYIERMEKPPAPMLEDYKTLIDDQSIYVLEKETQVIGVLVLLENRGTMILDNIAVHPGYQSKGYGRKLMSFAEETAKQLGYNEIILYTNMVMAENLEIYRHLGWTEYDRKTENGYNRVYMKKILQ